LIYFEVSAKNNSGIAETFAELGEKFIAVYEGEVDQFVNAE